MTALTTRDKLPYPLDANETVGDLDSWLRGLALATQVALDKRQQGTYVWVDDDARGLQTGMKQGDEGYVLATKTPYTFDGGSWRLATPHMEFTAALAMTSQYRGVGVFAVDAGPSTSTSMATITGESGRINITDPGLYAITATLAWTTGSPSQSGTLDIARGPLGPSAVIRSRPAIYNDLLSAAIGNYRTTAPNEPVYINGNVTPSDQATTRVRITRLA